MSALQLISLSKPVDIDDTVPRIERKRDIDKLAAYATFHGLVQNLTLTACGDGKFAPLANTRRHAALKLLVRQGERAKDGPTPWQVAAQH